MSSYLTEAEELTRRYDLDERRHHRVTTTHHPAPRRRTRVAARLRRMADRLEQ